MAWQFCFENFLFVWLENEEASLQEFLQQSLERVRPYNVGKRKLPSRYELLPARVRGFLLLQPAALAEDAPQQAALDRVPQKRRPNQERGPEAYAHSPQAARPHF